MVWLTLCVNGSNERFGIDRPIMISIEKNELRRLAAVALVLGPLSFLTACASVESTSSIGKATYAYGDEATVFNVCSGYNCIYKDSFALSRAQEAKIVRIMKSGRASAKAERRAIARVVAQLERFSRASLRFSKDVKFSYQRHQGKRGQMDCVDESLNTTAYLKFLQSNGLLKYHTVFSRYAERGFILDGRFPHKSARIRDKSGKDWAVDSWKRDNGGKPVVMALSKWQKERDSTANY